MAVEDFSKFEPYATISGFHAYRVLKVELIYKEAGPDEGHSCVLFNGPTNDVNFYFTAMHINED